MNQADANRRQSTPGRSGNPAKAAQQEKARLEKAASTGGGSPFGNPDGEAIDYEKAAAALELPQDFSKYLK